MSEKPVLAAAGSHLYPGATGQVAGAGTGDCLVEFADGSAALGRLSADAGTVFLETDPYVTARGTEIPARRWAIEVAGGRFRVRARSQAG